MIGRLFTGLAAAALLVVLSAGSVAAGGWATISADSGNSTQPRAGEPFTFGFTVLQHGVTPAGWVGATFVGINGMTGERIEVKAVNQGPDGHFVANVTLPSAGYWTWQVELSELIVETAPQPLAVATANGTMPSLSAAEMMASLERTRSELAASFQSQLASQAEAFDGEIQALRTDITVLKSQRDALRKQVETLAAAPAPSASTAPAAGIPALAIVAIAVLAGAISAFVITALGRGSGPVGRRDGGALEEVAPPAALAGR